MGGGKIESFVSFCGGLPAPECSDNPLGYKFSWSPRGALLNMLSGAKYLQNGQSVEIEENGGLLDAATSMDFLPGFSLEGYPNRDSTIYTDLYGIREAHTVLRGTLRYKGYTKSIRGLANLGLLDANPTPVLHENGPPISWKQYMCHLTNQSETIFLDNLKEILLDRLGDPKTLKTLEDLGFLSDEPMAKTVGYPCAIATKMVLDGEIQKKGAVLPFTKDIYRPMLQRLALEGISAEEKSTFL